MKFGIEIDYKHTHKFCMKYCLHVNNYKHENVKLWDYIWQISGIWICISRNYVQRWVTKLYNY